MSEVFSRQDFLGYGYSYGIDLADNIMDDYRILLKEALTTIVLVFFAMFLFV